MSEEQQAHDDHESFAVVADQGDLEGAAVGLAHMARDLLSQDSVQATLDRIVAHAVDLVEGCEHAGVLLLHRGSNVETAAATSELVHRSDQAQGELGEGPCFDAAFQKNQTYRIRDMEDQVPGWPQYAPVARDLGIGSMMGFLLYTEDDDLGALDLYSSEPNMFTYNSELAGWLLASHAAVAFSAARNSVQLESAVHTRQDIGEALGIIRERFGLDNDAAFALLKKVSQDHNLKIRDLARNVTTQGELPNGN